MKRKSIWVAGDFFQDEFNEGTKRGDKPRFDVQRCITRPGGALNTFKNLKAILQTSSILSVRISTQYKLPVFRRWIQDEDIIFEAWDFPSRFYSPVNLWRNYNDYRQYYDKPDTFHTLVVSDYDKGGLKSLPQSDKKFEIIIVDSKHRTTKPELIQLGKVKIWRCTGDEYDTEWANNFDWVVWTNHEDRIQVFKTREERNGGIDVINKVPAVDPIGAGDTFTAALAAYLTKYEHVNWETMMAACSFAAAAGTDVCAKKYTAITELRLEE